jgi:hypothetical protein
MLLSLITSLLVSCSYSYISPHPCFFFDLLHDRLCARVLEAERQSKDKLNEVSNMKKELDSICSAGADESSQMHHDHATSQIGSHGEGRHNHNHHESSTALSPSHSKSTFTDPDCRTDLVSKAHPSPTLSVHDSNSNVSSRVQQLEKEYRSRLQRVR